MYYKNYIKEMTQLLILKGCTPGTIQIYEICMNRVLTFLDKPVDDITTDDISNYLHHLITLGRANSTINNNHSIINFFFSKVLRKHHIVEPIPFMRKTKKLPETLSIDEINAIFNCVRNLKHKTIFMTIYGSGLRIGEALRLRISDIDSKKMQLRIKQGKGQKDRYTILSERNLKGLRDYYLTYRPEDLLFFPHSYKDKSLSKKTLQTVFKSAVAAAGINKKVTPHSLRHGFASHLLENGTDIYTIKSLLGHSSLRSTEVYLQLSPSLIFSTKSPLDQESANE
jgi:site-specific recombinase XerD